uniref:Uncharacterized protein n=1 Tax=Pipistrellus kuhlii TaxID=59472 RepID=A0A7J7Y9L6_PIPKU|nr:hypothetical protein mPipKuh1_010356 [Pipistrellus kuhlii]
MGSIPQPSATLAHSCLFRGPFPPLPPAHTSPQEMRTTWGGRPLQRGPKGPHSRGPLPWAVPLLSQPQFLHLTRPLASPSCREWSGALLCLWLLSYIRMHSDPIGNTSHVPEGSHSVCAVWTWRLAFLLLFSFPASLLSPRVDSGDGLSPGFLEA